MIPTAHRPSALASGAPASGSLARFALPLLVLLALAGCAAPRQQATQYPETGLWQATVLRDDELVGCALFSRQDGLYFAYIVSNVGDMVLLQRDDWAIPEAATAAVEFQVDRAPAQRLAGQRGPDADSIIALPPESGGTANLLGEIGLGQVLFVRFPRTGQGFRLSLDGAARGIGNLLDCGKRYMYAVRGTGSGRIGRSNPLGGGARSGTTRREAEGEGHRDPGGINPLAR